MKTVCLLKLSLLDQVSGEICAMVCSDDSIHIPLKLTWIVKGTFKPILEGFAWSHPSITLLISHWKFALTS